MGLARLQEGDAVVQQVSDKDCRLPLRRDHGLIQIQAGIPEPGGVVEVVVVLLHPLECR